VYPMPAGIPPMIAEIFVLMPTLIEPVLEKPAGPVITELTDVRVAPGARSSSSATSPDRSPAVSLGPSSALPQPAAGSESPRAKKVQARLDDRKFLGFITCDPFAWVSAEKTRATLRNASRGPSARPHDEPQIRLARATLAFRVPPIFGSRLLISVAE